MNVRSIAVAWCVAWAPATVRAEPSDGSTPVPVTLEVLEAKLDALQQRVTEQATKIAVLEATSDVTAAAAPAAEPTFDLHGFIDMGAQRTMTNDATNFESTASTFVLGNINFYFTFKPTPHWSSLTEIRFTTAPDGQPVGIGTATPSRINTEFTDPANGIGDDRSRWGAIVLERAYIEYQSSHSFGLRVGAFLTPFGIWNVDHGSPTVIPIVRPESMTQELFPKHQVGVELFGSHPEALSKAWDLEYHAYVSNGRTPAQVDTTEDKMFGGRLVMTNAQHVALGVSAMYGSYDDLAITHVAYRELGLSADVSIDLEALRLRAELTARDIHYDAGHHAITVDGAAAPNEWQTDAYVLAAYRIPHTRFEPYVWAEAYRVHDIVGDLQLNASVGLNIYFTPAIQLKLQTLYARFFDTKDIDLSSTQEYELFVGTRLVMGL